MHLMNKQLSGDTLFVALLGASAGWSKNAEMPTYTVMRSNRRIPKKFQLQMHRRKIVNRLRELLGRLGSSKIYVLCHYLTTAVLLRELWRESNVTCLTYCHGHDVTWDRKVESFPLIPAHGLSYKRNVRRIKDVIHAIANSEATRLKLRDFGFSEDRVFKRYLGVDLTDKSPRTESKPPPLRVLYLGRLVDFKGPRETIQAFSLAVAKGLDARLEMVGDGALRSECEDLVRRSGLQDRVAFHGAVSYATAMSFLKEADIFTAHNKRSRKTGQEEALGVSVLEAMAYGVPVVTGSSGGVVETVVDSVTGILFEPGDVAGHAEALLLLHTDPALRRKLGMNGRQRMEECFDVQKQEPIREMFDKLCSDA